MAKLAIGLGLVTLLYGFLVYFLLHRFFTTSRHGQEKHQLVVVQNNTDVETPLVLTRRRNKVA